MIRVVTKLPGERANVGHIVDDLPVLQRFVGGYLEAVMKVRGMFGRGTGTLVIYGDEEARLKDPAPSLNVLRPSDGCEILGPLLAVKVDAEGDHVSMGAHMFPDLAIDAEVDAEVDAEIAAPLSNVVVHARRATSRDRDAAARGANVAAGYAPPPPAPVERCPRCHQRAPRADGIPCALCCPMVMTLGDRWLTPAAPYDLRTRDVLVLACAVGDGTRTLTTLRRDRDLGDENDRPTGWTMQSCDECGGDHVIGRVAHVDDAGEVTIVEPGVCLGCEPVPIALAALKAVEASTAPTPVSDTDRLLLASFAP